MNDPKPTNKDRSLLFVAIISFLEPPGSEILSVIYHDYSNSDSLLGQINALQICCQLFSNSKFVENIEVL